MQVDDTKVEIVLKDFNECGVLTYGKVAPPPHTHTHAINMNLSLVGPKGA